MNIILDELDREIARAKANDTPEGRAYLDGVQFARRLVGQHMADWFNRKLTAADTLTIRERVARGEKQYQLAAEYGVSVSMISKIASGTRRAIAR